MYELKEKENVRDSLRFPLTGISRYNSGLCWLEYCIRFSVFSNADIEKRHLSQSTKMVLFNDVSERTLDGETADKIIGVRPIHVWWR